MANGGNFWTGISEGYFARRREHEAEAKQQEMDEKKQYFNLLANMVDKVEVESQPLLFKAMGDVLGAKGKSRSIWDFISGAAVEGNRQAAQKVYEDTVGRLTTKPFETAFQPQTPEQFANRAKIYKEKLILRDPRQEKMEDFEQQKKLLFEQRQMQMEAEQRFKTEQASLKAEAEREKQRERFEFEASAALRAEAQNLAASQGATEITPDHLKEAASRLHSRFDLNNELTRKKIQALGGDGTGNVYLTQGGQISLAPIPGALAIKPSQAATAVMQRIADYRQKSIDGQQFAERLNADVVELQGKLAEATATIKGIVAKGKGVTFQDGQLKAPDGKPITQMNAFKYGLSTEDLQKAQSSYATAKGLDAKISTYASQISSLGGKPVVTAPSAPSTPSATRPAKAAKPVAQAAPKAGGKQIYAPITEKYKTKKVGDTVSAGGKTYKIAAITKRDGKDMFVLEVQ